MPDGRTHIAVNAALMGGAILTLSALRVSVQSPPVLWALCGALFGTLLVTPDLDMLHVRTEARRAWGRLGWIWLPLLAVSRHRGVSHSWLRGPLLRLAYLGAVLGALGWGLGRLGVPLPARSPGWLPLTWGLAGYLLAQWAHLVLDGIPLSWRRL